jgi:Ca-activated chloride channel homolog
MRLTPLLSYALAALLIQVPVTAPPLHAQDIPVFKVESHLIDTTLSVRDAGGKLVSDLNPEDFTILEDGVPQKVRFFARENQLPLSIGLIIDASGSQEAFVKQHEQDIEAFLKQVITSKDEAFAVCFNNRLRLVSNFTTKASSVMDGIRSFDQGDKDFPVIGPKEERVLGTALYDAVYFGTEKFASVHQRRKVLVVFSDGEENSSEHDLIDAISAAQNADVLVYAIRYTDLKNGQTNARDRYGMRTLDHLTEQTGGKSFDFHTTDLTQDFNEIAGDLRSLYAIAYQSTNPARDGTYRKVVINTTRPGFTVRARAGYYAR